MRFSKGDRTLTPKERRMKQKLSNDQVNALVKLHYKPIEHGEHGRFGISDGSLEELEAIGYAMREGLVHSHWDITPIGRDQVTELVESGRVEQKDVKRSYVYAGPTRNYVDDDGRVHQPSLGWGLGDDRSAICGVSTNGMTETKKAPSCRKCNYIRNELAKASGWPW